MRPVQIFITQSLVWSIDACRGLGISPLQIKKLTEFLSARSWPNIWPAFFFLFLSKLGTFLWRFVLIASGTEIRLAGIYEAQSFFGNIAFPLASVYKMSIVESHLRLRSAKMVTEMRQD